MPEEDTTEWQLVTDRRRLARARRNAQSDSEATLRLSTKYRNKQDQVSEESGDEEDTFYSDNEVEDRTEETEQEGSTSADKEQSRTIQEETPISEEQEIDSGKAAEAVAEMDPNAPISAQTGTEEERRSKELDPHTAWKRNAPRTERNVRMSVPQKARRALSQSSLHKHFGGRSPSVKRRGAMSPPVCAKKAQRPKVYKS